MSSAEVIAYPLLFLAVFFESFLLVTFLSRPARESRGIRSLQATPRVAIIVPCWNEETTLAGTVESLLALDYPATQLSLILVNDGSTDATPTVVDRYASHPQITALHKENGGKYTAMNLGLAHAHDAEFVGFLDADSYVAPDALKEIIAAFSVPDVMAVTASMSIHEPRTFIQRMQYAEYTFAIMLRHILSSLNGLYVTPGPFSFYRREVFTKLGLFKHAYLAEDMEMAMRIQRAGHQIGNAMRARVYTKGPPTFPKLIKQRVRWTTGFLRNLLFEYRDLIGARHNRVLGSFVLPLAIVAIGGGILLFVVSGIDLIQQGWHAYTLAQVAPLSYAFAWRPFSWFYLPITMIILLGSVVITTTLTWMYLGKNLSRTPGRLVPNVVFYLALYWFVAPIWLIRSLSDVARGVATPWR
ncbi:MAG: glycosyltransferase [Patescibacteria group bacterium]